MAGASLGRVIAVSSTIAQARSRMVSRGANGRSSSGGTRKNGLASTFPTFQADKPPDFDRERTQTGLDAIPGDAPFILHEDGLGWLYVPKGLQDGPISDALRAARIARHNALYSRDTNPAVSWFTRQENRFAPPGDSRFPFVLTTYRLTEHHTAGGMSRFLSHLAELQPEMFAEISPELAAELKIKNGDYVCIVSLRGAIEARALVSRRIRPMHLNGKTVHQIAMPFHFGAAGPLHGDAANDLVPISGEPNVTIMEAKALACNHRPWSFAARPRFRDWFEKYAPQAGPPNLHPEQPPPGDGTAMSALLVARNTDKEGNDNRMIGEGTQSTNQRRHTLCAGKCRSWFLHRSDCLHRLQSLRSRVQRMERSAG